jgi:hypothetical protein
MRVSDLPLKCTKLHMSQFVNSPYSQNALGRPRSVLDGSPAVSVQLAQDTKLVPSAMLDRLEMKAVHSREGVHRMMISVRD